MFGRFAATNGGAQTVLDEISSHDGTVNAGLLISLMDRLEEEDRATPEILREVVSHSRAMDCTPSIRASEILLEKGDTTAAMELLSPWSSCQGPRGPRRSSAGRSPKRRSG